MGRGHGPAASLAEVEMQWDAASTWTRPLWLSIALVHALICGAAATRQRRGGQLGPGHLAHDLATRLHTRACDTVCGCACRHETSAPPASHITRTPHGATRF